MELDVTIQDTRASLARWGLWWRQAEQRGLGYATIGPGQRLIELARLGCRIQVSRRQDQSENIRVPAGLVRIDALIASLPLEHRRALTFYYIRNPHLPRRKVKGRANDVLLQAEMRVMYEL